MAEIVDKVVAIVTEAMENELALPIVAGIAALIFVVILFNSMNKKTGKSSRRSSKKNTSAAGGTMVIDGVRRSTRAHKSPTKLASDDFIALDGPTATTPRASRGKKATAETPKEAVTVSPKKRGRPSKAKSVEQPKPPGRPSKKSV